LSRGSGLTSRSTSSRQVNIFCVLSQYDKNAGIGRKLFVDILGLFLAGLWIRIDLIRIRIQHFCSIRFRIQAKTEILKTISFSNFFEIKIWVK
jgi:hypothetical protein